MNISVSHAVFILCTLCLRESSSTSHIVQLIERGDILPRPLKL